MVVEQAVEIRAPLRRAYDQWTQLGEFPRFLPDVREVRQVTDRLVHWRVAVGGVERECDALIDDQVPDDHVAWHTVGGTAHRGRVVFSAHGDDACQVTLCLDFDPAACGASDAEAGRVVGAWAAEQLRRFRDFAETHTRPTGAWRGEVHGGVTRERCGEDEVTAGTWDPSERGYEIASTQNPGDSSGRRAKRKGVPGVPGLGEPARGPAVADDEAVPDRARDRDAPSQPTPEGRPVRRPIRG
jgi:hypothetical protein